MKIFQQIPKVMADMDAISKDRTNQQQGWKFRGIDDIYNCLHSVLAKHGVFTAPEVLDSTREERATKSGSIMMYSVMKIRFRFYADDGSFFDTIMIGEASDSGDKASNKSMAIAHKYALLQVFAIPTEDDKDPDASIADFAPRKPIIPWKMTAELGTAIKTAREKAGVAQDELLDMLKYEGVPEVKDLTEVQYKSLMATLEKIAETRSGNFSAGSPIKF